MTGNDSSKSDDLHRPRDRLIVDREGSSRGYIGRFMGTKRTHLCRRSNASPISLASPKGHRTPLLNEL